jgi:broad specificity phosphatase PhoE
MQRFCIFLLPVFILISVQSCSQPSPVVTTFILIRHAEKADDGTRDPELKPEGESRAKLVASMFQKTSIDAIYSTNYKRTRNTVAILAGNKNVEVKLYEPFKEQVIDKMLQEHTGGTIIISGHSNNIPWTANLLLGKEAYGDYPESDYGNLLIVSVVEKGKVAKVTHLRY